MIAARPAIDHRVARAGGGLLLAGLLVAGLGLAVDRLRHAPAVPPGSEAPAHFAYGPGSFTAALRLADEQVLLGTERVGRAPEQWAYQESYARALMGRARLTGSFDDLATARAALERGLHDAPTGAGPLLTDAVNAMSVHRMTPVPRDLALLGRAAIPAGADDQAEALAIGGDVAFYSGRYAEAARAYAAAGRLAGGAGVAVRLANWHKKMGHFDDALAGFDAALRSTTAPTRQFYANMLLQMGVTELDRGRWDEAAALFHRADAAFPGWWLIEAHVAQMRALSGDLPGAERAYRAILSRSDHGREMPEVMDALAALYRARGDVRDSRLWADRAGRVWARRTEQLPEAAYGHALEHELVLGSPTRALALARANMRARPYGDSATMLAWTELATGDPAAAVRQVEALNRTGWRTAQQYVVLTEALAMLGRADDSDRARAQALAINPRAFDPAASLIWFGNH